MTLQKIILFSCLIILQPQKYLGQVSSKIFGKYYSEPLQHYADSRCKLFLNKDHTFEMEYEDDSQFYKRYGKWELKSDTLTLLTTKVSGNTENKMSLIALIFYLKQGDLCPFKTPESWCCVSKKNKKW